MTGSTDAVTVVNSSEEKEENTIITPQTHTHCFGFNWMNYITPSLVDFF